MQLVDDVGQEEGKECAPSEPIVLVNDAEIILMLIYRGRVENLGGLKMLRRAGRRDGRGEAL